MSDRSQSRAAPLQRGKRDGSRRMEDQGDGTNLAGTAYDHRRLSYANTFDSPAKRTLIKSIELMTGKLKLLTLIRRFEAMGVPHGQPFFDQALDVMGIEVLVPQQQIDRIPAEGPLVITANHPHGLVDGMVLAQLIGRRRTDYRILTRSLLTGVGEIQQFMIPVPFAHAADAMQRNLAMRKAAMAHLGQGGCIVLFPSGVVATSRTAFGPVVEADWTPFTAKMIQRSGAAVVPIRFPGANSRAYQVADKISPTLRQGLLLHEVVRALNTPQSPVIGAPIDPARIRDFENDPRGFMAWLRAHTLSLQG